MSAYHDARLLDPPATSRVLVALADGPRPFAQVLRATGLRSGTLSMTLCRMAERGQVRRSGGRRGLWELAGTSDYAYAIAWTDGI